MSKNEKIIIGSAITIAASALVMTAISKKYDNASKEIIGNLENIKYTLHRSNEDIIAGNKAIDEGNKLLRNIVTKSAEESVSEK